MVIEAAQVALGVGVQALIHEPGDDLTLGVQRPGRNIHQMVQTTVEVGLVLRLVGHTGQVQRDHADAAGRLAGAKETAGLLSQLTQVQTQAAAHAAHVAWLHIGVDVV